ncbi:hypothetical protein MA16_Dca016583 [Dendrobium catenatum]|uniref:Uncharacterized protein n=1 Tax=Dendrobium catenatum TaxID=906689 RepID=A0A2I0VGV7_9ASPA|nr:hypothetical protein MA16_Dca016583 [Dendrobium catenatum]
MKMMELILVEEVTEILAREIKMKTTEKIDSVTKEFTIMQEKFNCRIGASEHISDSSKYDDSISAQKFHCYSGYNLRGMKFSFIFFFPCRT